MGPLEEHLLARLGVDGSQGVVGTAKGHERAVVRPAYAVHRVERHRHGQLELAFLHIPDLDLSEASRRAAADGQARAVRREGQGLDALRQADQPGDQLGAIGLVEQHLVVTGDGQQAAVGGVIEAGDDGGQVVDRRMGGIDNGALVEGRVVLGPLLDPGANQLDLVGLERILAARHGGLLVGPDLDLLQEEAHGGLPRHDARQLALALFEQIGVAGHNIAALRLGRLMAALAMLLEKGPDVAVITDGRRLLLALNRIGGREEAGKHQPGDGQQQRSNQMHRGYLISVQVASGSGLAAWRKAGTSSIMPEARAGGKKFQMRTASVPSSGS